MDTSSYLPTILSRNNSLGKMQLKRKRILLLKIVVRIPFQHLFTNVTIHPNRSEIRFYGHIHILSMKKIETFVPLPPIGVAGPTGDELASRFSSSPAYKRLLVEVIRLRPWRELEAVYQVPPALHCLLQTVTD